ncbi:MAG: TlpA disulfide reductase family protein [Deltaproteobacteria bacterium]|nr:TlpA disulfide reductase family protein [Deltaproteobacteria bacterium]
MNKKILLVLMILLTCLLFALSLGQCRTGVSSKQEKNSAPDFSLKDIQGKAFKLSSQRGNPVVMFFGTTWCPACRAEMPFYKDLYEKYAQRGLKFIYIDINESTERVTRFAKQNSFPYLVLVDSDGSVANDYSIIGVPTLILVDKEGTIIGVSHRTSDLPIDSLFQAKK